MPVEPPARGTRVEACRAASRAVGVANADGEDVAAPVSGVTVERLREVAARYDLDPDALRDARERHDERSQLDAFRAGERTAYDDVAAVADLPPNRGVVSNSHHSTVEFRPEFFDSGPRSTSPTAARRPSRARR